MKAERAFAEAGTDKGVIHGYDRFYDELFENYIPDSLLEIGIKGGHSLAAWKLLFPKCNITGIDIKNAEFTKKLIAFSNAKIIIEDSTKFKSKINYDVIVDDGSHYYKDIMKTFLNLHTNFKKYYIIEDWHYDLDIARRFLNKHGYHNISFHLSNRSRLLVEEKIIFKTKSEKLIRIDQNMIVIKR